MAIHNNTDAENKERASEAEKYPSSKSITLFNNGTPGIRYKTDVAKAISGMLPIRKIVSSPAINDETKAAIITERKLLNLFSKIKYRTKEPVEAAANAISASLILPPANMASKPHEIPTANATIPKG